MTSLAFMECCQRLSVTPKTLRQWLAQAEMSLHPHPTDARITCLTSEQLHLLAQLHGRVLHPSGNPSVGDGLLPDKTTDADLQTRLAQLEAQVATLQTQLTDLALQLLKERQTSPEQASLDRPVQQTLADGHVLAASIRSVSRQPVLLSALECHPTEKPHRLVPLIEYGAQGRYVLISPEEGELPIIPDSPEWFAWLASLSSFRFIGRQGRFSARRGYNRRPNRSWYAQRGIHQKNYSKYIGVSEHVTVARLEQVAAHFQSYLTLR